MIQVSPNPNNFVMIKNFCNFFLYFYAYGCGAHVRGEEYMNAILNFYVCWQKLCSFQRVCWSQCIKSYLYIYFCVVEQRITSFVFFTFYFLRIIPPPHRESTQRTFHMWYYYIYIHKKVESTKILRRVSYRNKRKFLWGKTNFIFISFDKNMILFSRYYRGTKHIPILRKKRFLFHFIPFSTLFGIFSRNFLRGWRPCQYYDLISQLLFYLLNS